MQALEEVGNNPFGATLKIVTKSADETKLVADYIESIDSNKIVKDINYTIR
jgi:hypothetical protein